MISDYTLTIIEDNQVPLAASFDSGFSYLPVVVAVMTMIVFVAVIAYTLWFISHRSHILALTGRDGDADVAQYFAHPRKLLQLEYEVENKIVEQFIA